MSVILILFAYTFIGGVIGRQFYLRKAQYFRHNMDAEFSTAVVSAAWAIALPIMLGYMVGSLGQGTGRAERRRRKELDEAEHRLKVARINSKATAELERNLLP